MFPGEFFDTSKFNEEAALMALYEELCREEDILCDLAVEDLRSLNFLAEQLGINIDFFS